jgi:predicted Zn finger-like uncharacterized protein
VEFDCPECGAPHAFPEDSIPSAGLVVACTRCDTHITLSPQGVVHQGGGPAVGGAGHHAEAPHPDSQPDILVSDVQPLPNREQARPSRPPAPPPPGRRSSPAQAPEADPRDAVSQIIDLDVDAFESGAPGDTSAMSAAPGPGATAPVQAAMPPGPPSDLDAPDVSLHAVVRTAQADARTERPPSAPADPGATGSPRAAPRARPAAASGDAGLAILAHSIEPLRDLRRIGTIAGAYAALLAGSALLQWLAGWLGSKVSALGTLIGTATSLGLAVALLALFAAQSYIAHRELLETTPTSLREALVWVRGRPVPIFVTPLVVAVLALAPALVIALAGVVGRLPGAGPVLWGVLSPLTFALIPVAGLGIVFAGIGGPLYVPAHLRTGAGPVELARHLLDLCRAQGGRVLVWPIGGFAAVGLGISLAIGIVGVGEAVFASVTGAAMGAALPTLLRAAPAAFGAMLLVVAGPALGAAGLVGGEAHVGHTVGGVLAGLSACAFVGMLLTAIVQVWAAAGVLIYRQMEAPPDGV